jgi:hypothetical protein
MSTGGTSLYLQSHSTLHLGQVFVCVEYIVVGGSKELPQEHLMRHWFVLIS